LDLIFFPDWRSGHRIGMRWFRGWMRGREFQKKIRFQKKKKVKYFSAIFFAKDFWTMIFLNEAKFFSCRKSLEF
jgi:hypothetical protein